MKVSDFPLHYKTITEVAELIRSRKVSPVEVTGKILNRIEELDGRYNTYATLMADQAMG